MSDLCIGKCDPGEHRRCSGCGSDLAGRDAHFDERGYAWCITCAEKRTEVAMLRELVRHCWVHSGYRDCGYDQMETEMRDLYRRTIGRAR